MNIGLQPQPHYKWDFGVNNNTGEEYNNLINELKSKESRKMSKPGFVGRGKAINHSIVKIDEPSHDKDFDTHAHDYNSKDGKACSQSAGELSRISGTGYLTYLIRL